MTNVQQSGVFPSFGPVAAIVDEPPPAGQLIRATFSGSVISFPRESKQRKFPCGLFAASLISEP
jgi:hypothetical protein